MNTQQVKTCSRCGSHNWFKSSWKTLTPRAASGEPTGPHDFFTTGLVCHSCGLRRAGRVRLRPARGQT